MKTFTTKQEASYFFETLSEADYIFFANECSKFVNHSYYAENIEKSLRNQDLLAANETLQSEKQNLEEKIKALEQNHKIEKESFENKLQQERITELTKIKEEVERLCKMKYKNDIDNMENEKRCLEAQLRIAGQLKNKHNDALKNLDDCNKHFIDYATSLVKKPEKSQGLYRI